MASECPAAAHVVAAGDSSAAGAAGPRVSADRPSRSCRVSVLHPGGSRACRLCTQPGSPTADWESVEACVTSTPGLVLDAPSPSVRRPGRRETHCEDHRASSILDPPGGLYFIAGHQPNPTGNRTPLLSLLEAGPVMLESLLARAAPFPVPLRLPAFFGPIVHYVGVPWGDIGNWFPQSSPRKLVSSAPGPRQLCCPPGGPGCQGQCCSVSGAS
jgi:hypothetical protein